MSKPRVCSFESRRRDEMRSLIERHGGEATVVASMQEVPLEDNTAALELADKLEAGTVDYLVFMTGVGAETLRAAIEQQNRFQGFFDALRGTTIILRGPKPKSVLHKWGIGNAHIVKEPNTWRELVLLIDEMLFDLQGKTVAVQEYGVTNTRLYAALEHRGAVVLPVPVYRWKLPDDTAALSDAIAATVAGRYDAIMFTSANQLHNVLQVATESGSREAFVAAAKNCLVASIGPTCSEAITAEGMTVGFEASPPKMGPFARGTLAMLNKQL